MTAGRATPALSPERLAGLAAQLDRRGVVAIVSAEGSEVPAAQLAVDLAEAMVERNRRVVVVDALVERGPLHRVCSMPQGEGLSDFMLFGLSPKRVAQGTHPLLRFITAGTVVFDAGRVRQGGRWQELIDAVVRQADGVLMLCVPAAGAGVEAVLQLAGQVVLVGSSETEGDLGSLEAQVGTRIAQRLVLPEDTSEDIDGTEGAPSSRAAETAGVPDATLSPADVSDVAGPGAPSGRPSGRPSESGEDVAARRSQRASRGRDTTTPSTGRRLAIGLFVVFLATLAYAVWSGAVRLPKLPSSAPASSALSERAVKGQDGQDGPAAAEGGGQSDASAAAFAPQGEAVITAELMTWMLTVASFEDAGAAAASARRLERLLPATGVAVAPVQLAGRVVNRVMAGPVADSLQARELGRTLVGRLGGEARLDDWVIRQVRLAFPIDEFEFGPDAEARAGQRVEQLQGQGIPAHVLALGRSDGSTVLRIYAGAFAEVVEAGWLASRLAQLGIEHGPLSDRVGVPVAQVSAEGFPSDSRNPSR